MKDITVISVCRNIGRFLHPAIGAVGAAIQHAETELSISVEWLVAVDYPNAETNQYLETYLPSQARVIATNNSDIAAAKNQAIKDADGQYVAIVAGDDLISQNWLSESFKFSANQSKSVVFHPGTVIVFGDKCFVFVMPDQDDPDFTKDVMLVRNPWTGASFGAKEIFSGQQFRMCDGKQGWGHSDWHWNCESVAQGVIHKPVAGTIQCCRVSQGHACITVEDHPQLLIPSTKFFQPQTSMAIAKS